MKRIFLIGDSIRMGYQKYVRELLNEEAQVYWDSDNSRFVHYTYNGLSDWAQNACDPARIDLIHWNNGIWDAQRKVAGEFQTLPEEYRTALHRIIDRMHVVFPNAKIVFALTTQVNGPLHGEPAEQRNEAIEQFNAIACEVMAREGVPLDDLYTVAAEMPREWHSPDGTHFTEEGSKRLAEQVVKVIREQLN